MEACNWITRETKGDTGNGEWLYADGLGAIAAFLRALLPLWEVAAIRYISLLLWLANGLKSGN